MNRVAVIGAGGMGAVHIRVLEAMEDVQITWIADQHLERARSEADAVGARATTDNLEAIRGEDVEAVIGGAPEGCLVREVEIRRC